MARQIARKLFVTVFALSVFWGAGLVVLGAVDGPLRPLVSPRMVEPAWMRSAQVVFDATSGAGEGPRSLLVRERVNWSDASALLLFAVSPAALLLGGRAWWRWARAN